MNRWSLSISTTAAVFLLALSMTLMLEDQDRGMAGVFLIFAFYVASASGRNAKQDSRERASGRERERDGRELHSRQPSIESHLGSRIGNMKPRYALLCGLLTAMMGCSDHREEIVTDTMVKIELDLDALDEEGLRGPPDGKVAVAYEFSIPNTDECKREVRRIDPSVSFMPGARGRVGAEDGECLCIGSTHQQDYRVVLRSLSALPYVDRIIECYFE